MLPLRGWRLCITGAELVNHVNQVQRLSTNWIIDILRIHANLVNRSTMAVPKKHVCFSQICRRPHHRSDRSAHITPPVKWGWGSWWTLSQQYVWQSTRVLVGDFEMYVWDSQHSTMAAEGDVLIVLLWTLRQQCVWRSTIAVVYKPRIDNNRWKLWQSIGRTSDIHKQMTHSVKQGSLLSCVIDQPTEALINHIDQFGQPCQIRSIHTYSRFTISV